MVKVRWKDNELNVHASDLRELLKCLRRCYPELQELITPQGTPTGLLLVFVNSVEFEALDTLELRGDEEVDLVQVLHRG